MKLKKYNEARFSARELWGVDDDDDRTPPKKDYDMLYLKTIFNEILEDTKDLLDDHFVNALDRDAKTSISKVNKADHVGFFGRYRIIGNYSKEDRSLPGLAKTFGSLTEDFLDIETGLKHLEMEFKNESIFGEDFPPTTFIYEVKLSQNDRGISYEFVLDMKF